MPVEADGGALKKPATPQKYKKNRRTSMVLRFLRWSEWRDLNPRYLPVHLISSAVCSSSSGPSASCKVHLKFPCVSFCHCYFSPFLSVARYGCHAATPGGKPFTKANEKFSQTEVQDPQAEKAPPCLPPKWARQSGGPLDPLLISRELY